MQKLAPTNPDRNPNQHSDEEVYDALTGKTGARRFSFRYELLDAGNVYVQDLERTVLGCTIEQNWLADIKRTGRMLIRDTGVIDFLSDRIKPYIRTWLPPYGKYDFVEHPQGVFLLVSPKRKADEFGVVTRDIQCYDSLQVFSDDIVETRYTVASGSSYITAITTILGSIPKIVTPSSKTLPAAMEWDPGTSKLRILNELLNALNYESLSFDEEGQAIVQPYRAPSDRAEEYTYGADDDGLIVPDVEQEIDLFNVPNKWVLVVSDPDKPLLKGTYTNTDPASLTSTVRRGRTIVDFRTEQDAADLATLEAKAARLAFEASQIYESVPFETALMPIHAGNDVYRIQYPDLAINAKYSEQAWSLELSAGAKMKHTARRVVTI